MKEFKYTIKDELGIHARPAGLLVKAAAAYPCRITITAGEKSADAKRILTVMALGVKCGAEVSISAEGEQEEAAIEAMQKFMEENL